MATGVLPFTVPASITTPDSVETRLGTLKFFDGLPDAATVEKLYDNLDFQRGVQAFLAALPAAVFSAIRTGVRTFGPDNQTVLIPESLMDSRTLFYGANSETVYFFVWLDVKDGPLVIHVPPRALGIVNDAWGRYVADIGNAGPDKGKGGKYLLLPPGHTGDVPDDYFVVRPRTFGSFLCGRGFLVNGDPRPAVDGIKHHLRVYPLARVADPPLTTFVDISGEPFNTIAASDASLFDDVAQVVQEEPLDAVDAETRGLLAAIGIRKGTPFAPDARRQRILAEAAAVANATARALVFSARDPDASFYPDSAWETPWIGGYDFSPGGILDLDARTRLFYVGWGVSPAMTVQMVGLGSQYAVASRDGAGRYLDGGETYRLRLPPNIPAKDFWSVIVHDPQTRSMLQTDQRFPSLSSQTEGLVVNSDGSVDLYFGPEPPSGKDANWIQTIPGKGWYVGLRLYGPLASWFDKTWRPGEIERVE
jgi:hypothetical protein